MLIRDGILGKATGGAQHLVKGGNAITGLELEDGIADFLHDPGYVVACVGAGDVGGLGVARDDFPVFGVGAAHDDLDEDVVRVGEFRDRNG